MNIRYLPVSWNEYHELAQKLAAKLLSYGKKIDEIVAISRGGLTLGHAFTDLLQVTISTFTIQSYTDVKTQGKVRITKPLSSPIYDKHILLVDDVSDTGKTLLRALEYLKTQQPKTVTTLTLFYKPHSVYKPDYFAKTTPDWIIFPYETTETIISISKKLAKEGKTKKEITTLLQKLNFTREQISFVRTHHLT